MNAVRESWTDDRLDDLNDRVSVLSDRVERGFEQVHRELDAHRSETRAEFKAMRVETGAEFKAVRAEMKAGFDDLHRLMLQIGGVVSVALLAVIATLLGVVATQL